MAILEGYLIGLWMIVFIGPVFFTLIQSTLHYGVRLGLSVAFGIHGTIVGIFFTLPILATNALFERKSWKYIWINAGYWIICTMLMGGFICQFA